MAAQSWGLLGIQKPSYWPLHPQTANAGSCMPRPTVSFPLPFWTKATTLEGLDKHSLGTVFCSDFINLQCKIFALGALNALANLLCSWMTLNLL